MSYLQGIATKQGGALWWRGGAVVLIAWVPMQLICRIVNATFPGPSAENLFGTPYMAFVAAILFAPIFETQLMRLLFFLLGRFFKSQLALCWISAAIWGVAHLSSESWGLHAIWAFFVFGICYLRLQESSKMRAILVVTLIHTGCNALSYVTYLITEHPKF